MGVLNITPDSFSDGGRYLERGAAIDRAMTMVEEGADIIDVGGESTRPGAAPVPLDEEIKRVMPVIQELAKRDVAVSIDTTKAEVARQALECGVEMVNDVSALTFDREMAPLCARYKCAVLLMHMRGTPVTMQQNVAYRDILDEVTDYLKERIDYACISGVERSRIAVDPGIGFGKSPEDNLKLINNLNRLESLERPIVLGASRKSFIGKALDRTVDGRFEGSAATVAVGIAKGANIVRVHDIGPMRMVADMADAIVNS
ncbi:MAG: dihydropteroate synthase [Thermodesulfobacteriota bacterium]